MTLLGVLDAGISGCDAQQIAGRERGWRACPYLVTIVPICTTSKLEPWIALKVCKSLWLQRRIVRAADAPVRTARMVHSLIIAALGQLM